MTDKQTWKVVGTDNFARETVADELVAESFKNHDTAKLLADALNKLHGGPHASRYYVVKPAEYRLCRGMEDFM